MGSRSSRGTDISALEDFCVVEPDVAAAALAAAAAAVVDEIESVRLREAGSICMAESRSRSAAQAHSEMVGRRCASGCAKPEGREVGEVLDLHQIVDATRRK